MMGRAVCLSSGTLFVLLTCLAALVWQHKEPSVLLDWEEPSGLRGPSVGATADGWAGRGREPLIVKAVGNGGSELAASGFSSASLQGRVAGDGLRSDAEGRETELDQDDDSLSEAELASRLGRAIDRHEKCRRHWPHLQRLEAAQEIRVHDARNNLEVANRGMERARKELVDAENLVMAARAEHLEYEAQRRKFHDFRKRYNRRLAIVNSRKNDEELYQKRENEEETKLKEHRAKLSALKAQSHKLLQQQNQIVELEQDDSSRLKEIAAVELAEKRGFRMAHGEKLAQFANGGDQAKHSKDTSEEEKPVLTQESDGIVYPADASDQRRTSRSRVQKDVSLQARIAQLTAQTGELSKEEVDSFASLPHDERRIRELRGDIKKYRRKTGIEATATFVAREKLARDQSKMARGKTIKLDQDKVQLAHLNELVNLARESKARHELAQLKNNEAAGPMLSRQLSLKRARLAALKTLLHKQQTLAVVEGISLKDQASGVGSKARTQQLTQLGSTDAGGKQAQRTVPLTRAQLEADLKNKTEQLDAIKQKLLKVDSEIRPTKERVEVDHEMLKSRSHELSRATALVHAVTGKATQKLFDVYNERLKELHDERRKADALLAKAERMLNIARLDTEHSTRTKKAALEELTYATAKLRKYQDLRAKSQHCQMDAWSTIRRLTHRARERKMLETADLRKAEALRAAHDRVREQELSEIG